MNWYEKSKSQPKEKIVAPFGRSMAYASNSDLNWYRLAVLEYQLNKEAGLKEGILAFLLSILSSISAPYEARAIKNFLDQRDVSPQQQQMVVNTVNKFTDQNKSIGQLDINDVRKAVENIRPEMEEQPMELPAQQPEIQPQSATPQEETIDTTDSQVPGELNVEEVKDSIRKHEGKNKDWGMKYLDPSKKNYCVGYGFNLNKPNSASIIKSVGADYNAVMAGRQRLSEAQMEKILDINVKESVDIAKSFAPNYEQLPSKAKLVLVDMAFMGKGTLGKFNDLRKALAQNDFNRAADEMMDSLWAKQVGRRAVELAQIMRSLG